MLDKFFNIRKPYFIIGYFLVLLIDIVVKVNLEPFPFRYFTKPFLMVMLTLFYIKNHTTESKEKHKYMLAALFLFLLADIAVINHLNKILFIISMFMFIGAKAMYCLRFTNDRDFKLMRLLPFLTGIFVLMIFVFFLIYDNLGNYFIPVLIYFFVSLLLFLFAYLRKNDVNTRSYNYVIIAMFIFLFAEVVMVLKSFYKPLPFEGILVMLGYGISQFLIVYGVTIEVKMDEVE